MFARTSLTRLEGSRSDSNRRLIVFQESSDSARRSSADTTCIRDFVSKCSMNDCSSMYENSDARLVIIVATKLSTMARRSRKALDLAFYTAFQSSVSAKCSPRYRFLQSTRVIMGCGVLLLRDFHARIAPLEIHF